MQQLAAEKFLRESRIMNNPGLSNFQWSAIISRERIMQRVRAKGMHYED
jgi:hypothetical protein